MTAQIHVLTPDTTNFDDYMRETEGQQKVRPARDYLDGVMHLLAPAADEIPHARLPFRNAWLEFRPEEVTAWAGFNGSGKSLLQGQVMAHFATEHRKCCIASFEMKPARTLQRMVRQSLGISLPTKQQVSDLLDTWSDTLWFYDQQGSIRPDRMLAVVRYCAQELGIQHIAIDSLLKCVRGEDDYNGQKDFIDALTVAAKDYRTHIHVVMHLRKGDGDSRLPNRMDIRGAGAISDLVDNVLVVWRNKEKERKAAAGQSVEAMDPDALIICDKSRNGDWEGRTKLWFRKEAMSFADSLIGNER